MRRGEIYWHRFRSPDKRRPVLILSRTELLGILSTATVAALTSTIRDVPSEVILGPAHGLPKACAANLNNVFTVAQAEIGPYLTMLSDEAMARVDAALVFALGVGERSGSGSIH